LRAWYIFEGDITGLGLLLDKVMPHIYVLGVVVVFVISANGDGTVVVGMDNGRFCCRQANFFKIF